VKAYYFQQLEYLCGLCHYYLLPQPVEIPSGSTTPMPLRFECMNPDCPQHAKPIDIPPVEVEVP
jgi:hypothetical protein